MSQKALAALHFVKKAQSEFSRVLADTDVNINARVKTDVPVGHARFWRREFHVSRCFARVCFMHVEVCVNVC